MHVVEQTDAFTLVGSDARRGKLTLFAAEGPREQGALKHVALRVSSIESALGSLDGTQVERPREGEAYLDVSKGCGSASSRRRPSSSTTSTTLRSGPARRRRR